MSWNIMGMRVLCALVWLASCQDSLAITIIDLGSLGGNTNSWEVNNAGQVTGGSMIGGNYQAYRWQGGSMTGLGFLSGHDSSQGNAINELGHVAGVSYAGANDEPVLWKNGMIIRLGTLGKAGLNLAEDLNDSDQVVGRSNNEAFIWDRGVMTGLGMFDGDNFSHAYAINNSATVVGVSGAVSGTTVTGQAFKWHDGAMSPLVGLPGASLTTAWDINDSGLIVGTSGNKAVYWQDGSAVQLPDLGSLAFAWGVNEPGEIVGIVTAAGGTTHAALWLRDHTLVDLQNLARGTGWTLTQARGINDAGQIVGIGYHGGSTLRAWTMTVPTPGAMPILLGALLLSVRRSGRAASPRRS